MFLKKYFINIIRLIYFYLNKLVCCLPGMKNIFLVAPQSYISLQDLGDCISEKRIFNEKHTRCNNANCLYGTKHPDFTAKEIIEFPASVWTLKNGLVFSDYGYVLLKQKKEIKLVRELSIPIYDLDFNEHYFHEKYRWRYFNRIKRINGTVAVINSSCSSHNYYHWLIETLPRLFLIKKSGINPDYYYISNELPFHRDAIKELGIPEDKIISPKINTCIEATHLVVPSLVFQSKQKTKFTDNYIDVLPSWACEWLNSLFTTDSKKMKKIYISRKNAYKRKILNENKLILYLKSKGFEIIELEGLAIKQQAELFMSASTIVSPHGAGLANLVFCKPQTKLIEILPEKDFGDFYKIIADNLKIDYNYLFFPYQNENFDFYVDMDIFIEKTNSII